jgi:hypothetical protein
MIERIGIIASHRPSWTFSSSERVTCATVRSISSIGGFLVIAL